MSLLLVFGITLLAAVLVSARAERTVLSTNVLFLVVGFLVGPGVLGWVHVAPGSPLLGTFSQLALFGILFVDALRLPVHELRAGWRLPGRALLLGLPLTTVMVALLAWLLFGVGWVRACLLGAILCPTDPVFAAAILQHEAVPKRLRSLLTIESSINDGLALPLVMVLLELARDEPVTPLRVTLPVVSGIALGVALGWSFVRLEASRFFEARESYRALGGMGLAITLYGLYQLWHVNEFLAVFSLGVTLASLGPECARAIAALGEPLAELLKLAAVLLFGILITPELLREVGWKGWLFAALTLLVARPAALLPSFAGSGLTRREWWAAAWFGPKGFASIVYALFVLGNKRPEDSPLFQLVAVTTAVSMVAHSSTDVLVARLFRREEARRGSEPREGREPESP